MIRIITGTLVMAGKGLLSPDEMKNILEKKDRQHYGKTLPAFPLTFLNAKYANYHTPRELLPYHEMGISKK
jgi:tRNA U38,U39,U40 pseudouridine synthase TruA